ncbi:efflux RND transporter periplasmic adaptor subunit [Calidifontibacillus oryziterrae]|uniref:efflux RND transporter periplasmic adaptor subunit n=1 Tax=Calidifontibacillus oryziterrae TaxID=1191699 RepID=UPI0002F90A7A|nr:efflux RND transporter periplasmic adaptor subunit [Calidifontibacillus oryziterrae]
MKKQMKWLITIIVIVSIGGYSIYSSVKPLETTIIEVQPQTVAQTFKEEGIVTSAQERLVYSLVNGAVKDLPVVEGQSVKQGELLVNIESKDLEAQLGELKGQLQSVQGQQKQSYKSPYRAQIKQQQLVIEDTRRLLNIGQEDYERIKTLYENGAVSKKELDSAENQVIQLENSLLQQQQALKLIEEQAAPLPGTDQYYQGLINTLTAQINYVDYLITNSEITSPINGVIKQLNIQEGELVTPQSPLLALSSKSEFEVEVYLLTEDVLAVKEGMKVELIQERRDEDYSFKGVVKSIAPAAEEKVSALGLTEQKVKVTITPEENMAELRPGYALDVLFTTLVEQNKLAVPKVVLFPYEDGDALWVVKDGKAIIQKVETGLETDELIVIEKGLAKGDFIIKNSQLEGLVEGKRIKIFHDKF